MFCQCTYNPVHDAFYLVLSDTNPLAGIAAGAIATILICEPTILLPQLLAFPTLCLADVGIQQLPPCALAFLCTFDPSRQLGPLTSQLLWSSMTHLPSALPPPCPARLHCGPLPPVLLFRLLLLPPASPMWACYLKLIMAGIKAMGPLLDSPIINPLLPATLPSHCLGSTNYWPQFTSQAVFPPMDHSFQGAPPWLQYSKHPAL